MDKIKSKNGNGGNFVFQIEPKSTTIQCTCIYLRRHPAQFGEDLCRSFVSYVVNKEVVNGQTYRHTSPKTRASAILRKILQSKKVQIERILGVKLVRSCEAKVSESLMGVSLIFIPYFTTRAADI